MRGSFARGRRSSRSRTAAPSRRSGLAEPQVEAANLDLLARVRLPENVALHPVGVDRLDDRDPRKLLEEDRGHLSVRALPERAIEADAGGGPELVEAPMAPGIHDPARGQQSPHEP